MINLLLSAIWFLLPAMTANALPVPAAKRGWAPKLNLPLDHGRTWRGKPLFGKNKTYRGLVVAILGGALIGLLQASLQDTSFFGELHPFHETLSSSGYVGLGILLGLGAIIGDAVESMLKRQLDIPPGSAWFPFDQVDYIFGALLFALPFGPLNILEYAACFFVGFALHIATTFVGFKIGYKDSII